MKSSAMWDQSLPRMGRSCISSAVDWYLTHRVHKLPQIPECQNLSDLQIRIYTSIVDDYFQDRNTINLEITFFSFNKKFAL